MIFLSCSSQIRTQLKRKAYEDAGLQPPSTTPAKATTTTKVVTKQTVAAVAAQVAAEPQAKKQKTSGLEIYLAEFHISI